MQGGLRIFLMCASDRRHNEIESEIPPAVKAAPGQAGSGQQAQRTEQSPRGFLQDLRQHGAGGPSVRQSSCAGLIVRMLFQVENLLLASSPGGETLTDSDVGPLAPASPLLTGGGALRTAAHGLGASGPGTLVLLLPAAHVGVPLCLVPTPTALGAPTSRCLGACAPGVGHTHVGETRAEGTRKLIDRDFHSASTSQNSQLIWTFSVPKPDGLQRRRQTDGITLELVILTEGLRYPQL